MNTESNRVEYKEKLTDDLEQEVVAFLNAAGGDIISGVRKNGTVVGAASPDEGSRANASNFFKNKLINTL